jgi:ABC-2 type transport system ATP-binding protein
VISIHHATKLYGTKPAVSDLSLEIGSGQLFAFLGPNGAGKTTTIKMLVGLLRPSAGQLRIDGVDVVKETQKANRLVGYVPDEPYLYDKLTGREFLEFTAGMYGIPKNQFAECVDKQIQQFELEPFVDQLCERYSHGMKQRVVFAAAMIHNPKVLVVDEPMVGLDPRSMRSVKDLLRRVANAGASIFMSTHTLTVAEEIADRIGVITHGILRFEGTVDELRRTVRSAHSADASNLESLFLEMTSDDAPETICIE